MASPQLSPTAAQQTIQLEEGWGRVKLDGINKLCRMIEQKDDEDSKASDRIDFTNAEYMELYTTVYRMCIQKAPFCFTPELYARYEVSIQEYLTDVAFPAIKAQHGPFMLKELVKRWENHKLMKKWMVNIFRYLNRFYIKRHNKHTLEDVAVMLFRRIIFEPVVHNITQIVLSLVEKDRQGEDVDRSLLRAGIQLYVDMGMDSKTQVYTQQFEGPFLKATSTFYSAEAAHWLEQDSCPEYLKKAERRIEQERQRVVDYLHNSSETALMETLHKTLLLQHEIDLLNKEKTGARSMLESHASADFARMFKLYSAVSVAALQPIADIVSDYIKQRGLELVNKVNAEKRVDDYIEDLIKVHDKYYELVMGPFQGNATFHRALKEAFEAVVNKPTFLCSTSELLANHADKLLVKGGVRVSEQQLQDTLDKLVRLFSYLADKDMFAEFYRKHLSKRLLLRRSASDDAERAMIGKLKLRCGAQFTSKLEGMINDMRRAEEHQQAFVEYLKNAGISNSIDFSVQVLTTGFWPSYPMDDLQLNQVFLKHLDTFQTYYNGKTNNRRLRWIHHLGEVTLSGSFEKKKIDLVVSTVQASILLLFNEREEVTVKEVEQLTGLPAAAVKKYLRSLVSGKLKILLKKPPTGYTVNDVLRPNSRFTHQQRRVRVPHVSTKSSADERKSAENSITEDRRHAVEANIVRVMKARKTLPHAQLMSEVSQQLMQYFTPDPRQIKKRIEDLIQREYLERDAEESNVYHYLA